MDSSQFERIQQIYKLLEDALLEADDYPTLRNSVRAVRLRVGLFMLSFPPEQPDYEHIEEE